MLAFLFDTFDAPKSPVSFTETLKQLKVSSVLSQKSISELNISYALYLEDLAQLYFRANKLKDFPYEVKTQKSPLLEFANPSDLTLDSDSTLSKLALYMEQTI